MQDVNCSCSLSQAFILFKPINICIFIYIKTILICEAQHPETQQPISFPFSMISRFYSCGVRKGLNPRSRRAVPVTLCIFGMFCFRWGLVCVQRRRRSDARRWQPSPAALPCSPSLPGTQAEGLFCEPKEIKLQSGDLKL